MNEVLIIAICLVLVIGCFVFIYKRKANSNNSSKNDSESFKPSSFCTEPNNNPDLTTIDSNPSNSFSHRYDILSEIKENGFMEFSLGTDYSHIKRFLILDNEISQKEFDKLEDEFATKQKQSGDKSRSLCIYKDKHPCISDIHLEFEDGEFLSAILIDIKNQKNISVNELKKLVAEKFSIKIGVPFVDPSKEYNWALPSCCVIMSSVEENVYVYICH